MRFITEFECDGTKFDSTPAIISYRKERGHLDMGEMIANSFGWQERGQTTLHGPVKDRFTIEIEAFQIDKWIEFKKRLSDALPDYDAFSRIRIINALADLESSIGKEKLPG